MATTPAQARAARRAAATRADTSPIEDVMPDNDIDAAFGPDDLSQDAPVKPARAARPTPVQTVEADDDSVDSDDENEGGTMETAPTPTKAISRPAQSVSRGIAMPMAPAIDPTRQIDAADIIMPKLKVSQAMSKTNTEYAASRGKTGVMQGNWYHSISSLNFGETVYFVPVDMRKSRALFVQGQGLMCRSLDMRQGEGDPGILCEGTFEEIHTLPADQRGCPLRLWKRDTDTKVNTPPPCGMTYNYPGFVVTDPENPNAGKLIQVMLQLRSTGTQAAKAINTAVMNEGGGVWHNVVLELGLDAKTNSRGTFFVPTVEYYCGTDMTGYERVVNRAANLARQIGGATLRSSIEDDNTE